ncbi:MAG: type II secretion system protein [Candidatus Peribacteraceae bacterium]|jgi:type IV pilus assembly protein PilA|nr:type II secretion system protein [Candidatus Peribacteria bacterium]
MQVLSHFRGKLRYGFTLIELLLVIGIIAILASIVIVAINPTKQLGDARDAQRRSDVNSILNAVYQYAIDHNGNMPAGIPTGSGTAICPSEGGVDCVDLSGLIGDYLVDIPADPQAEAGSTNYLIYKDTGGRVTVSAETPEQAAEISVTR